MAGYDPLKVAGAAEYEVLILGNAGAAAVVNVEKAGASVLKAGNEETTGLLLKVAVGENVATLGYEATVGIPPKGEPAENENAPVVPKVGTVEENPADDEADVKAADEN